MSLYIGTLPTGERLVALTAALVRAAAGSTDTDRHRELQIARTRSRAWRSILNQPAAPRAHQRPVQRAGGPVAAGRGWFRVANADGDRAKVYIYEAIDDWYGVSAADLAATLDSITAPNIDLHVNSPGGLVFDGFAIYAALRDHPARVTAHVDGLAASAASFVIMAADEIVMAPLAKIMIHDASGLCIGNERDMTEFGALLGELSDTIASTYNQRAGGGRGVWRERMRAETWYGAEQAVAAGLADRVSGGASNRATTTDAAVRARHRAHMAERRRGR